jgi:hypothetical protein
VIHDLELRYTSGGDCVGGVHSPTFQDENPRSRLNLLGLAMTLLKTLFCERGLSLG